MISHHIVAAALAVGLAAPAGYYAFDREPPIVLKSVELLTPEVVAGSELKWRITFDRLRDCAFTRHSLLFDGADAAVRYQPISYRTTGDPRDNVQVMLSEKIQPGAAPGGASYLRYGEYVCNFVHEAFPIRVYFTALDAAPDHMLHFEITEPQKGAEK